MLNCSNEEPDPLPREDNYKNIKMEWGHLKIFFSRTTVRQNRSYLYESSLI
jgi:hypothetical protein